MTTTTEDRVEARIYVACLASYNAGRLYGKWINLDGKDAEAIEDEVTAMLKDSPTPFAEEWAIHDYEGFDGHRLGEWENFQSLAEMAELISEHGEAGSFFIDIARECGLELAHFERYYRGRRDSFREYADEQADELYWKAVQLAENTPYLEFDYEAFAEDYERNFYVQDAPRAGHHHGVHIFETNI